MTLHPFPPLTPQPPHGHTDTAKPGKTIKARAHDNGAFLN